MYLASSIYSDCCLFCRKGAIYALEFNTLLSEGIQILTSLAVHRLLGCILQRAPTASLDNRFCYLTVLTVSRFIHTFKWLHALFRLLHSGTVENRPSSSVVWQPIRYERSTPYSSSLFSTLDILYSFNLSS